MKTNYTKVYLEHPPQNIIVAKSLIQSNPVRKYQYRSKLQGLPKAIKETNNYHVTTT